MQKFWNWRAIFSHISWLNCKYHPITYLYQNWLLLDFYHNWILEIGKKHFMRLFNSLWRASFTFQTWWKLKREVLCSTSKYRRKKPQNILGTVLFKPMFLLKKERDPKPKHSLYCKRLLLLKHHCFERLFWTLNNNTTISYRQWCFFFAFLFLLLLLNTVERWRKVFTIYQLFLHHSY